MGPEIELKFAVGVVPQAHYESLSVGEVPQADNEQVSLGEVPRGSDRQTRVSVGVVPRLTRSL